MKILTALSPEVVVVSTEEVENGFNIAYDDGIQLSISAFLSADRYASDQFNFTLLYSPFKGEQEITELAIKGDTSTIGYIFPMSSLSGSSSLAADENKWKKVFGRAGSIAILRDGLGSSMLAPLNIQGFHQKVDISDLFPENVSVLVTGKEGLDKKQYLHDEAVLMVQEFGFKPVPEATIDNGESIPTYSPKLKLGRLSKSLTSDIQQISEIMGLAKASMNPIGRFLSLYQIIELLIQKVFECCIDDLLTSKASDPWSVRERLQEIVNEKWRIKQIYTNHFTNDGTSAPIITSFVADAKILLAKYPAEIGYKETDNDWVSLLYIIRNSVVHRQHLVVNKLETDLSNVCFRLEGICFLLLRCLNFSKTSEPIPTAIPATNEK